MNNVNYYMENSRTESELEREIEMFLIIFALIFLLTIIIYIVFNTLYNKKKKNVFLWLSLLPKSVLIMLSFLPVVAVVFGIHYKEFNNYKEIGTEIYYENISGILDFLNTNIDDIEEVFWYTSNNEDFVVLVNTKYKDYKVITNQSFLEILDIASELDSDLMPHEIKDITVFLIISYIVAVVLGVIFIKDKKNILLITAIAGVILTVILSSAMA